ncbi:MAG: DUF721 domain-containing protein [Elusimicrobia bacterium]|nr:DUF721 domain-containing protein [Elusimicrobiota bacterium]
MAARPVSAAELVRAFRRRTQLQPDKLSILNAIWERELGPLAKHLELSGVRRGTVYVRPASSAAAVELRMRASSLLRALNKYFSRGWIKALKATAR